MWKVTLKQILGNKGRLVGTAISVIIGIAFLAGSLVLTDTIGRTFDQLFADVNKTTDAYVRSTTVFDIGQGFKQRARIPDSNIATVQAVPGVAEATGEVQGIAIIVGSNGEPVNDGAQAPAFGADYTPGELSPWRLSEGRAPQSSTEVVVDRQSAKSGKLKLGQQVTVVSQGGSRQFTLVGIVKFGDVDSPGGASFALFNLPTAQEFVGKPGEIDAVRARAEDGVSQVEITKRIASAVGPGVEVLTGKQITKENQDDIRKALSFFGTFLTAFAVLALFVSSFIIYNTFSIVVAQRTRETALLRAVGASRRQVLRSMMAESAVTGLVASLLGMVVGVGLAYLLKWLFSALGVDIPATGLVIKPRTVVVSLILGVGITMISALAPAIRASRVPPLAAMRDLAIDRSATSGRRVISGLVIVALGILALIGGLAGEPIFLAFGVGLLFIGVFVLGPVIARPVSNFISRPLPRIKGSTGMLARQNAARNPKRTARTAAALMVGVAVAVGISVLAASIKTNLRSIIGKQVVGDVVISTNSQGIGGLSIEVLPKVQATPGVEAASGIQVGVARVNGNDDPISVVDPAGAKELFNLNFVAGSMADLDDGSVLLSKSAAEDLHKQVGDSLDVILPDGKSRPLVVKGIYDKDELFGRYIISRGLYSTTGADQFDFAIFVKKAPGASANELQAQLTEVVKAYPNADVKTRDQFINDQAKQINQLLFLVYLLLAFTVLIAVMGISNTLKLSVHERTRELGLMRAVGMTRSQTRSVVRWESVIVALLGTLQGILIGIGLAYACVLALRDQGLKQFTLPISVIIVALILSMLVGVISAWRPARRAARLNVLDAISTT